MNSSLKPSGKVLAIDFGGTKLAAGVVDRETGAIHHYQKRMTPKNATFEESLTLVKNMGDEILDAWQQSNDEKVIAVGVSFGGPISEDATLVLKSHHVSGWENFPLPAVFEEHFKLPTLMANDADAAAFGEWFYGSGERAKSFYYLQISTGIGAGLILNEEIFRGKGNAGEPGHLIVNKNAKKGKGRLCSCGKPGCLESYSAGWGITNRVKENFSDLASDSVLRRLCQDNPENLTTELVFEAYRKGDSQAKQFVLTAMDYLASVLANTICVLNPHKIGIGGGLTKSKDIIESELIFALKSYMPFMFYDEMMISFSKLGGRETLLGAALLT